MDITLERDIIRRYKPIRNLGDVQVGVMHSRLSRMIEEDAWHSEEVLSDLVGTVRSFALNIYENANRTARPSGIVPDIIPNFGDGLLDCGVEDVAREMQAIAAHSHTNLSKLEPFNRYDFDMLAIPGSHQAMIDWDMSQRYRLIPFLSNILYPMAVSTAGAGSGTTIAEFLSPSRINMSLPSNRLSWPREEFDSHEHLRQLRERCELWHQYIDAARRRDQLESMFDAFNGLTPEGVDQLLRLVAANDDAPLEWILSSMPDRGWTANDV